MSHQLDDTVMTQAPEFTRCGRCNAVMTVDESYAAHRCDARKLYIPPELTPEDARQRMEELNACRRRLDRELAERARAIGRGGDIRFELGEETVAMLLLRQWVLEHTG